MKRILLLLALAVASCQSPETSFYTLAPVSGTALSGGPPLVELRRPGIAGYLDRSEIVRANTPYRIDLQSNERWGEPFADMFGRVLAEDLHRRLPRTTVFTATGAISADAGTRVEIELQRFDADQNGVVHLVAQVAISRERRAEPTTLSVRVSAAPSGSSTGDYVAAMSQALGQAADQIARAIRR